MYNTISNLIITYLLIIFVICGVGITSFVLRGFGLYTIGKRQGRDNCFLAFIPYANVYFKGELSGSIRLGKRELNHPGLWLIVISLVTGMGSAMFSGFFWNGMMLRMFGSVNSFNFYDGQAEYLINDLLRNGVLPLVLFVAIISLITTVITTIIRVLVVLIDFRIYRRFTDNNSAVAHAVLSALVPLYEAICLFVFRNKPEVSNPQLSEEKPAE